MIYSRVRRGLRRIGYRVSEVVRPFFRDRSAALCLHAIGNHAPRHLSQNRFRQLVEWLSDRFESRNARELTETPTDSNKPSIFLTFDDGYLNQYSEAAPILNDCGMKATFFVPVASVGNYFPPGGKQQRPTMDWDHLEELHKQGHEIGSHGMNHRDLTTASPDEIQQEVHDSKIKLENTLDITVESFAYPSGLYNAGIETEVAKAGYSTGFTTDEKLLRRTTDCLTCPRLKMSNQLTVDELKIKLSSLHPLLTTVGRLI